MKYKYKKIFLFIFTIVFTILSFIELIKYLCFDSELFGLVYNTINVFILFLLIPVLYNYKRHYSPARMSKLILIIIIGIINSYAVYPLVMHLMSYIDTSYEYSKSIFVIKNIIKGTLFLLLIFFTYIESKTSKVVLKKPDNKKSWLF